MKLSCNIYPCTPIKIKIGGKILSKKYVKTSFYRIFFGLVKFLLRPENECVALIAFKLSAALNTLENGGHDLSTSLIRKDNSID